MGLKLPQRQGLVDHTQVSSSLDQSTSYPLLATQWVVAAQPGGAHSCSCRGACACRHTKQVLQGLAWQAHFLLRPHAGHVII